MFYALVKNGKVTRVTYLDCDDLEVIAARCPDNVQPGDTYYNGVFLRDGATIATPEQTAIERVNEIDAALAELDDAKALEISKLYPEWKPAEYSDGDRVRYGGALYRCIQSHSISATWTPTDAPSLWAEVLPGQSGKAPGEWKQPDSTNPYKLGDRVTHQGKTWESTVDSNVWKPGVYGWKEV